MELQLVLVMCGPALCGDRQHPQARGHAMRVKLPWNRPGNGEIAWPEADQDHSDDAEHVIRRARIGHCLLPRISPPRRIASNCRQDDLLIKTGSNGSNPDGKFGW